MGHHVPDKRYFKIGEVSKLAGVAPHVIRYWESEFSQITPKRAKSNQRLYRREDVELILKIRTLLHHQGFTIAGARRHLEKGDGAPPSTAPLQVDARAKLETIKTELQRLRQRLDKKR